MMIEPLDAAGFTQRDYDKAAPFTSFLPGIAGLYGKPLWCYYVNRGQAVACFGTKDKDHGIMPFQSAKLHYARVEQEGFRTLLRWPDGRFYEPFRGAVPAERTMTVTPSALRIDEQSGSAGLSLSVSYTTVPGETCAALLRTVTIRNISDEAQAFQWLDGFPRLIPYGLDHFASLHAPFICEGYLRVDGLDENLPYFRFLDAPSYQHVISDRPSGNFYFGFVDGTADPLPVVVDGDLIFGEGGSLAFPARFAAGNSIDPGGQKRACMTASAFVLISSELASGEEVTVHTVCGSAANSGSARAFQQRALKPGWAAGKAAEAAFEVEKVRHRFFVHSGNPLLDEYVPQTFLDNVLRGGLPITLEAGEKKHVLYVFNRVHGDLERDYNTFKLDPTYFSQGNGHYRDVNQNRRNDVWFNPDVGAGNLKYFFNLLRLDGYNPMECQGVVFRLDDGVDAAALAVELVDHGSDSIATLLAGEFTPGSLLDALEAVGFGPGDWGGALDMVLARASAQEKAAFGTGFWIDHWCYCFDHLDRFLALFPDRLGEVLVEDRSYGYWDDEYRVLPRSERYLLVGAGLVHQVGKPVVDPVKQALLETRVESPHQVRAENGHGVVYRTNLLEKIVCLIVNKTATIAPSGCGIEMEAGHPGWHDSINRLPYLFGSSTSELFLLLRAVRMMRRYLEEIDFVPQAWPVELSDFISTVETAIRDKGNEPLSYWREVNDAKESFRARTWMGLSGELVALDRARVSGLLETLEAFLETLTRRVFDPDTGLPFTYYLHRPKGWDVQVDGAGCPVSSCDGYPRVSVTDFTCEALPLFLEAPVHALRTMQGGDRADRLCRALRNSPLFDEKLKMYLLGDSVEHLGPEVGRIAMWTPGWFENENVFLHMEHKLLLAMFESGRYDRLFETMRDVMVPFQPVERYGRSPLENTSFIVSSRHPAPERHGRGYLPRSSGTTAEVLDLFLRMSFGDKPFRMEDDTLVFELRPVLPGWMFLDRQADRTLVLPDGQTRHVRLPRGRYAALFLGRTLIVYRNEQRKNTFGEAGVAVAGYTLTCEDATSVRVQAPVLCGELAERVRSGAFSVIDVELSEAKSPL